MNGKIYDLIQSNLNAHDLLNNVTSDKFGGFARICDKLEYIDLPDQFQKYLESYDSVISSIPEELFQLDSISGVSPETKAQILKNNIFSEWVLEIQNLFFEEIFVLKDGKINLNDGFISAFGGEESLKNIYAAISQTDFFTAIWQSFIMEAISSYIMINNNNILKALVILNCVEAMQPKKNIFIEKVQQKQSEVFLSNLMMVLDETKHKLTPEQLLLTNPVPISEEKSVVVNNYIQKIIDLKQRIESDISKPEKLNKNHCLARYRETHNLFESASRIEDDLSNSNSVKHIFIKALKVIRNFIENFCSSGFSLTFFSYDKNHNNKGNDLNIPQAL